MTPETGDKAIYTIRVFCKTTRILYDSCNKLHSESVEYKQNARNVTIHVSHDICTLGPV